MSYLVLSGVWEVMRSIANVFCIQHDRANIVASPAVESL